MKWSDWNFFDGYLSHKSRMADITVWSMGSVHGIQCGFQRDGEKGKAQKGDKHAVDLGKSNMPTANLVQFKEHEEIVELHFVVSESAQKGVIGQVRIKTRIHSGDGSSGDEQEYKFGRTTDGKEQSLLTPPGHRLLCLTGSNDDSGLRELGAIFVPKMERAQKGVAGPTFTLCGRARLSLGLSDGRVMSLDSSGRLVAMVAEGAALLNALLVLDGMYMCMYSMNTCIYVYIYIYVCACVY